MPQPSLNKNPKQPTSPLYAAYMAAVQPALSKGLLPHLKADCAALATRATHADTEFGIGSWSGYEGKNTPWHVPKGSSALHLAINDLDIPLATALLVLGSDANLANGSGERPLHMLAGKHGAKAEESASKLVELLLKHGADPALPNAQGKTPLQALAAKAPMSTLLPLLALRPEDVAGSSTLARQAATKLAARGADGLSLVEEAALNAAIDSATPAADASKPKQRL